ncbi:MAG: DUF5719 family protein [Candidatus Geothermincolia bacterium]
MRHRSAVLIPACFLAVLLVAQMSIAIPAAVAESEPQWTYHGVAVSTNGTAKAGQDSCSYAGGAAIVWEQNTVLRAQAVSSSGTTSWDPNGAVVSTAVVTQSSPQIIEDDSNGVMIAWEYGAANSDIYAQRLNSAGAPQWGVTVGIAVCNAASSQEAPQMISDGAGGAIITWVDDRDGFNPGKVYAQRLDVNGTPQWTLNGIEICDRSAIAGDVGDIALCSDSSGGAIFAWPDNRDLNWDIYAQRVSGDGTRQWAANGERICFLAHDQTNPHITASAMAGAIIAWEDERNGNFDIYAQRIDGDCTRYWAENGIPVARNERDNQALEVCADGALGALVVWLDDPVLTPTASGDIRAQRIDSGGVVRWASEGVSVCTGDFQKLYPKMANDGWGGAVIGWYDYRSGHATAYMQSLDAAGNLEDTENGFAVSNDSLDIAGIPAIVRDGVGGGIISWIREDNNYLMAQRAVYENQYYFAEGTTRDGFAEYICIGNPYNTQATANITYVSADGSAFPPQFIDIPATSRATVNVAGWVGNGKDISAIVTASRVLPCERPMYFNYGGSWTGGHDAIAATAPASTWYFAEGSTLPGFEEWVCVLNTSGADANLTFRFQTEEAGEIVRTGTVAAGRRASFKVNDLLGAGYQTSLALESDQPIVAERPMYFNYSGMGGHSWTGGHVLAGVNYLRRAYYFAEGTTRSNFEEWLTLQNPNASDITVVAEYQMSDSTTATATYDVAANKRLTVYVPGAVGLEKDVSVKLTSDSDFLAERPMYFNYNGWGANWTGGHCVIGASAPGDRWFFGEGATIPGFHQYLCIQNPGAADASVSISYFPQGGAPIYTTPFTVPAHSRQTVFVNGSAGSDLQLSTAVELESGSKIVVERPMYFDYAGWTGGHDVVGGYIYTGP